MSGFGRTLIRASLAALAVAIAPSAMGTTTFASLCYESDRMDIIYFEVDAPDRVGALESSETRKTLRRLRDVGNICEIESYTIVGHSGLRTEPGLAFAVGTARAEHVRRVLIGLGADPATVTHLSRGDEAPFRPFDGEPDPLNERVEITTSLRLRPAPPE